ncbi:MAG: alpha/beta fold hydrolase [Lutibacter sp.]|jgi:uncharacterized protein|nr:alpha/beta fold hydrolase [Lutibacter sp.]
MKKKIIVSLFVVPVLCLFGLYLFQEKLLFKPIKLSENYTYQFHDKFEEITVEVGDKVTLNGILFKSNATKGVVLYFHGNKGDLSEIGKSASVFTKNGYDVLYINYRGFGKSLGSLKGEDQLLQDAQLTYNFLKSRYQESQITLYGISIGSGVATYLAAHNTPNYLILAAPYSRFKDLLQEKLPIVPSFLWKYELDTDKWLQKVACPVTIFHGKEDIIIPIKHALFLKEKYPKITLVTFENYGHTNFLESKLYQERIILEMNTKTPK